MKVIKTSITPLESYEEMLAAAKLLIASYIDIATKCALEISRIKAKSR